MRGYFGIGVENLKTKQNLGTLWRSAYCMGASFIFVIGNRYKKQITDTVCAYRHIPLYQFENKDDFMKFIPYSCPLVGIELSVSASNIYDFVHPERAIYILGPEDGNLSLIDRCHYVIQIPSFYCLNVAVAGSVAMYDRRMKQKLGGAR